MAYVVAPALDPLVLTTASVTVIYLLSVYTVSIYSGYIYPTKISNVLAFLLVISQTYTKSRSLLPSIVKLILILVIL